MLRITSQIIREWGDATFGEVQDLTVLVARARQELDELEQAVREGDKLNAGMEAADVTILLHRLVSLLGADLDDMVAAKMHINRNRTWHAAGDGTGGHVKERYGISLQGGASLSFEIDRPPQVTLRLATPDDIPVLERWDLEPHVISSTTDNPDTSKAFGEENDWTENIAMHQDDVWEHWIAEVDGRPVGAMQMCDPFREPTHYWGEIEPNLRALDIWIGDATDRGKGYGYAMMRLGIERCFIQPEVTAVVIDPLNSNTRAHKFYQRLGFVPTHRQTFSDGEDDCLVHKLTRADWRARFKETSP